MRFLLAASALAACVAASLVTVPVHAHGGELRMPEQTPPAPAGTEAATAEQVLADVAAKAGADGDLKAIVAEAVRASRRALERAHGARSAGDATHARMLDGVALEWAETARDLLRVAVVEKQSFTVNQAATDTKTKIERARALLEETQARQGRLTAEVGRLQAEAEEAAKNAKQAEADRLRGGPLRGPKPGRSSEKKAPKGNAPRKTGSP